MAARHQENVRENNADVEKKNNMAEKRVALFRSKSYHNFKMYRHKSCRYKSLKEKKRGNICIWILKD